MKAHRIVDWIGRKAGTGWTGTVPDIDQEEQRLVTKESWAEASRSCLSIGPQGLDQQPNVETHQPKPI